MHGVLTLVATGRGDLATGTLSVFDARRIIGSHHLLGGNRDAYAA